MDHPTSSMPTSLNQTDEGFLEEPKKYSDFVRVAALTVGIPIIIFGFLGNLMTIIAVIKTKALRTGANIFIISLSVFDLMYVTIVIPVNLQVTWNNHWDFSDAFCKTYPVIVILTIGGNLMSLAGTAFNRYLKIIHPQVFILLFGRRLNTAILVSSFLSVPVLILIPPISGVWGEIGYDPDKLSCDVIPDNSGYDTFLMLCCFIVPIIIILFCYIRILCKVCANRKKIQAARNGDANQPAAMREDLRYTKMMVSIFAAFVMAYTPYFIYHMVDPFARHEIGRFLTRVCYWLGSCINPVLYGLLNRNFRQAFLKIYKDVKELTTAVTSVNDVTSHQESTSND